MRSIVGHATPLAAALVCLAAPAAAQVIGAFPESLPGYENDYLLLAPPPDPRVLSGLGVRLGDVTMQPVLREGVGYSSNPLGISPSGSGLLETNASLGIATDWARDALDASLSVDDTRYFTRPLADETNWTAALGGSLDVGRSKLDAGYSHLALNLDPEQLGTLGVIAPVPYTDDDGRLDADIVLGRVRLIPSVDLQNFAFGRASSEPAPQSFDDLDRLVVTGTLTGLCELSEGRSILVIVDDSEAGYRRIIGMPDSDYDDMLAVGGVDFQADAPIRVRAVAGGERRTFAASGVGTLSTPYAEVSLLWAPTRLTNVTLTFDHRLADAATVSAGTATLTEGRLQIDHALRRDVGLEAFADIGSSDYAAGAAGSGTSQITQDYGLNVSWRVSRHVALSLSGLFERNDDGNSNLPGVAAHTESIALGLTLAE